jgi:CBS domain-containing protein
MLVRDIMTSPAVTVREHASPETALQLLAERGLTILPVVDAERRLVGVVSEVDLLHLADPESLLARPRSAATMSRSAAPRVVSDVMTRGAQTTSDEADVATVVAVFRRTSWKSLPVMRGDVLVGVVSRSDLIRAMARADDEIEADVNRLLSERAPGWEATVAGGMVTIRGSGNDSERDAVASLAATVIGVRRIGVVESRSRPPTDAQTAGPLPVGWAVDADRANRLSGGTGVDQL